MKLSVAPAPHLRRAGLLITITSLVGIGFATLSPQPSFADGPHFCAVCGSGVSAVLNVILFVPLGIGLFLAGVPVRRALLAMCVLSALIETAQYFFIAGRYASIGDVLTNSSGGAIGFALGRYWSALVRPSSRLALVLIGVWAVVWVAIQTIAAFGFSPEIPRSEYYGQLAPHLEEYEQFNGEIVRASIGNIVVPDARFPSSRPIRELLLRGAPVSATVNPGDFVGGVAPIVRVADVEQSEIVLLARSGNDLLFGVRTGAAMLLLRPPVFAVAHVFPDGLSGAGRAKGALTVSARYSARGIAVNTRADEAISDHSIPITASLGWTMLLPFQWYIVGTGAERAASFAWIAGLLLPMGYWSASATRGTWRFRASRPRVFALIVPLILLYIGLAMVPPSFGLSTATLWDWLAAISGLLTGGALARQRWANVLAQVPKEFDQSQPSDCR